MFYATKIPEGVASAFRLDPGRNAQFPAAVFGLGLLGRAFEDADLPTVAVTGLAGTSFTDKAFLICIIAEESFKLVAAAWALS